MINDTKGHLWWILKKWLPPLQKELQYSWRSLFDPVHVKLTSDSVCIFSYFTIIFCICITEYQKLPNCLSKTIKQSKSGCRYRSMMQILLIDDSYSSQTWDCKWKWYLPDIDISSGDHQITTRYDIAPPHHHQDAGITFSNLLSNPILKLFRLIKDY